MAQQPTAEKAPAAGGIPSAPAKGSTRRPKPSRGLMAHLLAKPVTGTETLTVACKHPSGFRLQLHRWHEESEPVMGGGTRKVRVARPTGQEVYIRGTAHPQGAAPRAEMAGGYALTPGVPKDFWEEWIKHNAEWGPIKAGLLFAHESHAMVRDGAAANEERRSGLERIDPNNLPGGITIADERKAA